MVMDAVENCLRAITNYNPNAVTRTGTQNAFSYFTQICFFAFLRRIEKEKKQQDIKWKFIEQSGIEEFIAQVEGDDTHGEQAFIDSLRERIGRIKEKDAAVKEFIKKEKKNKSLELFMTDELVKEFILENSNP
jgi:DNA topoisomerase IA